MTKKMGCDWQLKVTLRKFEAKKGTIFNSGYDCTRYRIDDYGPCGYWCTEVTLDEDKNVIKEGRSAWHTVDQVDRWLYRKI